MLTRRGWSAGDAERGWEDALYATWVPERRTLYFFHNLHAVASNQSLEARLALEKLYREDMTRAVLAGVGKPLEDGRCDVGCTAKGVLVDCSKWFRQKGLLKAHVSTALDECAYEALVVFEGECPKGEWGDDGNLVPFLWGGGAGVGRSTNGQTNG